MFHKEVLISETTQLKEENIIIHIEFSRVLDRRISKEKQRRRNRMNESMESTLFVGVNVCR